MRFVNAKRLSGADKEIRDQLLYGVWKTGQLKNGKTGALFGLSYSGVSHAVKSAKLKLAHGRQLQAKFDQLKAERGISSEQVVMHIERGDVLGLFVHPNQEKLPNQQIIVVEINEYAYLVPFVESSEGKFLKTIIASRKATRDYMGGKNEQDKS